jgi:integrase
MALYKRNNVWWINITHQGKRIQKATGTSDKLAAQQYHDQVKANLWRKSHLQEKPEYTWLEATLRWLDESQHKRSIRDDKMHLRWLDPYFGDSVLSSITRDRVEEIAKIKEKTGVSLSTVNRMLAVIRAILRKAEREWSWLERAPIIRMRTEAKGRIRWLTKNEVNILVKELPSHLADMMLFTLTTGLRQSNVTGLQWENIDLVRCHALIHPDQSKSKKAIPVPLNADAAAIIRKQMGKHEKFVFSYRGQHITQCNTKAWHKALQRAGIKNFRWHDLRHTWASWHVQNGTTLQELQQLGGWSSFDMVLRYAHLSSDHLKQAAERVSVTNLLQLNSGAMKLVC